jgi:patatin-like phospholipase/acyl hydrolase
MGMSIIPRIFQIYSCTYTLIRGGIRGIVELEILRLIESVWGGGLRIQDFFDLIVGTR